MLLDRIGPAPWSYGIVVGLIEPSGRRVVGVGSRALGDTGSMDADTLFEIGSMTKVFTSLLLSHAAGQNELSLDDPAAKFLPASVHVPERGRAIRLVDLATHTSGLPRLPDNLRPADPHDPYADYRVEQLYQFLSGYSLPRDVGASYEYSNVEARAVVLHQNGRDQRMPRFAGVERTAIHLDTAIFDRYVGQYQVAPHAVLTISRDGDHFHAQLTGQDRFEIFAESERDFFLKVVEAQLSFEIDAQGRAAAVVLHQGGRDQRAPRKP